MTKTKAKSEQHSFAAIADAVGERLAKNRRVRRNLPGEGRLRIDRQLPFLCVYRSPACADAGTRELVTTEAAYLFASGDGQYGDGLSELCERISLIMQEHFGAFLIVEVWADQDCEGESSPPSFSDLQPAFEVIAPELESLPGTIDAFVEALESITIRGRTAKVATMPRERVAPPGLTPLADNFTESLEGCFTLGLAVRPIYRDARSGELYPMVLQALRTQLAKALRRAIAQFAGLKSSANNKSHYESLGPSSMVKAARLVDQQLCEVSETFDFILQSTPTNADAAWAEFQESGFQQPPVFHYRPLAYRPSLLKRRLFDIEIERMEDPTLAHLFWEKQEELDRQLSALRDLDTPNFLLSSRQLYGDADDALVALAEDILGRFPSGCGKASADGHVPTAEVAQLAREEIDYYHQRMSGFNAQVEICDHIAAGFMVSQGRLLIADTVRLRADRVGPLMHHEVGTHLLTYFNGRRQPFRQMYAGLAGYEELQEGLAVLAEHLTGGLTAHRLRTLAGRVIAARSMTDGASFIETFARLHETCEFTPRRSFVTTLRIYRGGGLTKDVIYLRGLRDLLKYLADGHDIEPLYVGKIGLHHLPYVQELRRRGVIQPPGVLPRFWDDARIRERLEACRGLSVVDLVETSA